MEIYEYFLGVGLIVWVVQFVRLAKKGQDVAEAAFWFMCITILGVVVDFLVN